MVDTHCHIFQDFYDNIDEIIKKMGNNIMIISGTNDKDNLEVLDLCSKYANVYGTLGIHPTEINENFSNSLKFIEENINNPKIVGIGEIGLDYHFDKSMIELQKKAFIEQLDIAKKYKKCVVIHSRDAISDTYDILKAYAYDIKINIHCFSGSLEMAKKFIDLGCKLGVGGVITFKNSSKLKEVVANVDLSNILLETDSPFLTPEPFRGKKNEPSNVIYVAKKISEIKNISIEKVLEITYATSISQFDLRI